MKIPNKVIHTTKPFDIRVHGEIKKYLMENAFDIVHAHGTRAASNLLWPCKSLNIPIIYTVHGWSFHDDQGFPIKNLRILSEKYISDRTTLNISVSESNQLTGRKYFGKYESEIVNNGIDLRKFKTKLTARNIRKELGIGERKVLVTCAMRMTKQKNPLGMIRAFKIAVDSNPKLHLLIVGDGELKEEAQNLVNSLKLSEDVTFEKFRSDIPDVLDSSDIYCLPSLWEGLPIGLLEAMGMGLPCVATRVDGSKEIIENKINGLLVEPEDDEELASALIFLSENDLKMKQFSAEAVKTVKERYNVVGMTRKIESIYKRIITQ